MVKHSSTAVPRPGDARRKRLNNEAKPPLVSNFFSIERYYEAADKAYAGFVKAFADPRQLDNAYVFGKRYCAFCIDQIPNHNYYQAPKYRSLRVKHTKQVDSVITTLGDLNKRMDAEEVEIQREAAKEEARRQKEAAEAQQKDFEALQQRVKRQQQRKISSAHNGMDGDAVASSAMSKLQRLRVNLDTKQEGTGRVHSSTSSISSNDSSLLRIRRDPSGEEPRGPGSRYHLPSDDDEEEGSSSLPPPLLPPTENGVPPPPSYNQVLSTRRNGRYRPEQIANQSLGHGANQTPAKRKENYSMAKLQEMYRNDYNTYKQAGSITIQSLSTYQGRQSSSTNGCTVISALVASRHLTSRPSAVQDTEVVDVIDRMCGPILREIRGKLGLGDHALIIPSDVHDVLVDKKILHQDYFSGAAGGNVMDPKHMDEFMKLLIKGEDGKTAHVKSAATFFFREHVICIVKTPVGNKQCQFDLIDSLPGVSTNGGRPAGSRTRCKDVNSLQVLMRWYTSKKFSSSDCSYIDRNEWADATADLDPRVFQGFVWAVKS
jgi:hypothetical protein